MAGVVVQDWWVIGTSNTPNDQIAMLTLVAPAWLAFNVNLAAPGGSTIFPVHFRAQMSNRSTWTNFKSYPGTPSALNMKIVCTDFAGNALGCVVGDLHLAPTFSSDKITYTLSAKTGVTATGVSESLTFGVSVTVSTYKRDIELYTTRTDHPGELVKIDYAPNFSGGLETDFEVAGVAELLLPNSWLANSSHNGLVVTLAGWMQWTTTTHTTGFMTPSIAYGGYVDGRLECVR